MKVSKHEDIADKELIDRLRADDKQAYQLLFDRYWELLYRIAQSLLQDRDHAMDIVQDVWLSLWERRKQIENQNIRAYLIQAVKFKVYKAWRDGKITTEQEEYLAILPAPEKADEPLQQQELEEQLLQSIDELPRKCREVFRLSRYEHRSNSEIAQELNLSKRTVETHISHALKHLRKKMPVLLFLLFSP